MLRNVNIDLEFQHTIPGPPASPKALWDQACSNDDITIKSWAKIWVDNITENHKNHGPFAANGVGKLFHQFKNQPVIIAGSGPSLAHNIDKLKNPKGMPIVSCLHNFHYMEDNDVPVTYYVSLDAGKVTLEEISEGGTKSLEEYLELSRGRTLLAYIGSHPDLIKSWRGKIIWFNAPIPEKDLITKIETVEKFATYVSSGGNVLGACFYIAKAILGANPIVFVGADFAFSYDKKFHPWKSKYDADLGSYVRKTDVFGNSVASWQSYVNFSAWFVSRCCSVPGIYINASEGGILGAFPEGNIEQIKQMALSDVIEMYALSENVRKQCENPDTDERLVLF